MFFVHTVEYVISAADSSDINSIDRSSIDIFAALRYCATDDCVWKKQVKWVDKTLEVLLGPFNVIIKPYDRAANKFL